MSSGLFAFLLLFAISVFVWLVLKPFSPKLTFQATSERVMLGWFIGVAALWMLVIYIALGFALCLAIGFVANLFGEANNLERFVNQVAHDYLNFLPRGAAEMWPAILFGFSLGGWNVVSLRRESKRMSTPIGKRY